MLAQGVPVVYDPAYQGRTGSAPLDPLRGEKVLAALEDAGLLPANALSAPRPASLANLLRVHTAEYLQTLEEGGALTRVLGIDVSGAEAERLLDLQRLMVGGTIQATRLALRQGGVAVHLGGGFHHALPDRGMGFCVFNDVAVAIARLRARGFTEPVLVVDLDLHDGNGTRAIFARDPSVHTYSLHNEHWGDPEAVESTSIALGAGVDDRRFLGVLRETLPPIFASFRPGLVVYVAGTDGAAGDAIGNWVLTADAIAERDRLVTSLCRPRPLVVVLGGGYGDGAWRHTARFVLWLASGRRLEPLDEGRLVLKRFRRLHLGEAEPDDGLAFTFSEDDLAAIQPGLRPPSRFLGRLPRHGVELLLEQVGILERLRAKGFRSLRVEVLTPEGAGHTLRILSLDRADELLVEVRLALTRGAVAGMEMVTIEWLLLQNPREPFSARHPRLPGQQHPGLGLLRVVMGFIVALCESQRLDGVHFVVAHYHVAMQSRSVLRFLDPEDEARTRALGRALSGMTLAEATSALAAGQVVDDSTGQPAAWRPAPMVLPVSERLLDLLADPEHDRRVEQAMAHFSFRVRPDAS
jgi:acetoin utilization deacetylase AcuC-like enzyme